MKKTAFVAHDDLVRQTDDALTYAHELMSARSAGQASSASAAGSHVPSLLASGESIPASMIADGCDVTDAAGGIASAAFVSCLSVMMSSLRASLAAGECPSVLARRLSDGIDALVDSSTQIVDRVKFDDACVALRRACAKNRFDPSTCEMVIEASRLAGLSGRIRTEICHGAARDAVELTHGYTFNVEPVLRTNDVVPWTATSARCVFIDGIIENVSEIDGMLQRAHSTREPLLICARGFGDDVVSTVAANRARKTLNVHIVIVPFDAAGANALKDMATVVSADVVSSLQGSLISTVKFDGLARADRVLAVGKTVTVAAAASPALHAHVAELARLRDACNVPMMRDAYSERIKSLSGTCVNVKLSGSKRECAAKLYQVDSALRALRVLLSHGRLTVIDAPELVQRAACAAFDALDDSYGIVPAAMLITVMRAAATCAAALCLSAGAVVLEQR